MLARVNLNVFRTYFKLRALAGAHGYVCVFGRVLARPVLCELKVPVAQLEAQAVPVPVSVSAVSSCLCLCTCTCACLCVIVNVVGYASAPA